MRVRDWLFTIPLRIRSLLLRDQVEQELDEELQFHFDQQVAAGIARGMSPAEAHTAARQALGPVQLTKEECRDMRGVRWLEDGVRDIGFAIRQLGKARGFTVVAGLSLALGIGANTAILTLIESMLLRPIPVKHADQLRLLTWRERGGGWVPPNLGFLSPTFGSIYEQRETADGGLIHTDFSPPVYRAFLRGNTVFDSLFGFKELGRATAVIDGNAETLNVFLVSGDFYRGMEVTPVLGRTIGPEDDARTQQGSVVVISYEYWTRRFARSPAAIGKTITMNGVPLTIVGVNPEYFKGVEPGANFEIWAPLSLPLAVTGHSWLEETNAWSIPVMGRLKPGIPDAQAQAAFEAIFQRQVDADYLRARLGDMLKAPEKRPHLYVVSGARGVDYLTPRYDRLLLTVLALAGLVLVIACANVANLLLARSALRQGEISLRLALGAGRWRIARQLLAEGLPLAGLAGAGGLIIGYFTRNGIPVLLAGSWRPGPAETAFDAKVLLASLGITIIMSVLFSLAPVWQSRRTEVGEVLKDSRRGSAGLSRLRMGRLLVVFQVALSVALLAGAGLCVKTFRNLRAIPLGFRPEGVLLFTLDPPKARYPADRINALLKQVQERLNTATPGVAFATFSLGGQGAVVGRAESQPGVDNFASEKDVGTRFFETMGIPILQGRAIDEHDSFKGPRTVVVNQEFERRFFAQENPLGRTFAGADNTAFEIVGVCADWRDERLRDPVKPTFYSSLAQAPHAGRATFEVRIAADQAEAVKKIRDHLRSIDPALAATDIRTEVEQIENGISQERLMASLATVFGVLALILASVGIYGVMAYEVARRTNEIGIRVALGARPAGIAWMVLRETIVLAVAGIAIGVPAVLAMTPVLDHVLAPGFQKNFAYGMKPNDPMAIALAVSILAAVGLLAGYLPAQRAARVDPMTALRHD